MLISLFSISVRFFVFLLKRCRDLNFFLRPKRLASGVILRAIAGFQCHAIQNRSK